MLATAAKNGWRPDMQRLERLEKVEQMQKSDYREAWGWMHFLLHSSPDTKQVLLAYLQELRTNPNPGPLRPRLAPAFLALENDLHTHLTELERKLPRPATAMR